MKYFWICIRLLTSILLLYFIFSSIQLGPVLRSVAGVPKSAFAVALGTLIVVQFLAAYKWQLLANKIFRFSYPFSFYARYYLIGYFYTIFVPGGQAVSEGVKAWRISRVSEDVGGVLSAQLLDRITGFIAVGILFAFAFFWNPSLWHDSPSIVGFLMVTGITAVGVAGIFIPASIHVFFPVLKKFLRNSNILTVIEKSFSLLHAQRKISLIAVGLALVTHLVSITVLAIIFQVFQASLPYFFVAWMYLSFGTVMFLPISYAGLGVREGVITYYGTMAGIPAETALAVSLFLFVLQIIVACIGGVYEHREIWRPS